MEPHLPKQNISSQNSSGGQVGIEQMMQQMMQAELKRMKAEMEKDFQEREKKLQQEFQKQIDEKEKAMVGLLKRRPSRRA